MTLLYSYSLKNIDVVKGLLIKVFEVLQIWRNDTTLKGKMAIMLVIYQVHYVLMTVLSSTYIVIFCNKML